MRRLSAIVLLALMLAFAGTGQTSAFFDHGLFKGHTAAPATEAVQAARGIGPREAERLVRTAPPEELADLLAKVPPARRAGVFLDMLVQRGSLSRDLASRAMPMLERLSRQQRFMAWALRHERAAGEALASIQQGRQTFAGTLVYNARIADYGRTLVQHVDLGWAIGRIRRNDLAPNDNAGWKVFGNYERLLPQRPRGWYREMRIPTKGLQGPGPQRLVYGRGGEVYWTPDHYQTFYPIEGDSDD